MILCVELCIIPKCAQTDTHFLNRLVNYLLGIFHFCHLRQVNGTEAANIVANDEIIALDYRKGRRVCEYGNIKKGNATRPSYLW